MANVSFIHISDLHLGDKFQKGLMSQTKRILFDDMDFILSSKIKSLEIVFFTGDLVQKGTKDEFIQLEEFLNELWQLFNKHGQNPYLLCVPGNHDLERIIDENNPIQKAMTNWLNDNIKDDYFWNSPNVYHDFIIERFKNYTEWYENTSIKKPESICWGYLPGDFYTSLIIENVSFGIVGLNSSFLQLAGGDAKQKLGIYNKQTNLLFKEKYIEWFDQQDMSILLTHHSPEWFEQRSFDEFYQEIYCNGTYIEHLCGHMHAASCTITSVNGFPSKKLFISPSLFGLEYYGEKSVEERIHGYTAGIYNIEHGKITKTIWPRISIKTQTRNLKICQNEEFNLTKDSSSFTETLFDCLQDSLSDISKENEETISSIEEKGGNLFSKRSFPDNGLPRTLYKELNSHMSIRFQERNRAINSLNNQKYCWIVTKFGLGEDEFIGSILGEAQINIANCFCINCDESSSIEELIETFSKIFTINITKYFDVINSLNQPLLVFDNLNEELIKNAVGLKEFIKTIIDFNPNLKVIVVSEITPDDRLFDHISLSTLDIPAVKQYMERSNEIHSSFTFLEYEKIHRISSGIPFYIDKVIDQLTFRPLSDLGDMEFNNSSNDETDYMLPKSLKNEINLLFSDESKQGTRRFTLLSLISLLHNGETFERIRRFDPTKPFHPDDISYLLKNKLIETQQINSILVDKQKDSELIKIIKAPRIIRDYVSSLIKDSEKVEIYKMACNLYLGSNWRNTIKLIQPKDIELDLVIYQNLQIAIRFLLLSGIEQNNEFEATRMTYVAMALIDYFEKRGSYKDAISLTEETLLLIKDLDFEGFENSRIYLTKSLGENFRMSSFHDKSITILKSICDDENNSLSKQDRNGIRLSIAFAYMDQGLESDAVKYANLIRLNESNKNSNLYLSAEYISAYFIQDISLKIHKLNALKAKAEKFGYNILKSNIIFEICKMGKDETQLRQLDKIILESKNEIYNKVRALVIKANIILNTKKIEDITNDDLLGLYISYSYTFYQRLPSLLNKCHNLAWQYWYKQNRFDKLLNLFRYSSFVWRLCGDVEQEQNYIDQLYGDSEFIAWFNKNKNNSNSIYYEQRIFSLYNHSNTYALE